VTDTQRIDPEDLARFEPLDDFEAREMTFLDRSKTVYVAGEGPAVIVMSEMPGITWFVARFARWVRDAGFTVFMPQMFGTAGRPVSQGYAVGSIARACISREFRAFSANASSPITEWLRALAAEIHPQCGGRGVGAIGMCFTGNFALSLMLEPAVKAPVLSQPSLPLGRKGGMHIAPDELRRVKKRLEEEDLVVLGYRFAGDSFCRAERFAAYEEALGDRFRPRVLPEECAATGAPVAPHSVVTIHLVDRDGEPTRQAVDEILAFFEERLR
jgi:dienelactone hydrolase